LPEFRIRPAVIQNPFSVVRDRVRGYVAEEKKTIMGRDFWFKVYSHTNDEYARAYVKSIAREREANRAHFEKETEYIKYE
jgi:hypothetical protein